MTNTADSTKAGDYGVIATLTLLSLLVLVAMLTQAQRTPIAGTASPAPSTSHHQAAPYGDGYAEHHLFSETADLDTSRIDDLRDDPYGKCVSEDGVLTPAGTCVDGVMVWRDEMPPGSWNKLLAQGYLWDSDDPRAMWIPLAMVTMDGEGGEVIAMNLDAPLVARS